MQKMKAEFATLVEMLTQQTREQIRTIEALLDAQATKLDAQATELDAQAAISRRCWMKQQALKQKQRH